VYPRKALRTLDHGSPYKVKIQRKLATSSIYTLICIQRADTAPLYKQQVFTSAIIVWIHDKKVKANISSKFYALKKIPKDSWVYEEKATEEI